MVNYNLKIGGHMNLREYLFYKNMSVREFCKVADFNDSFLSTVLSGKKKPSAKTLRLIERATGGKVKAENVCSPTKLPEGWEPEDGKVA
jgi:transcriptional regulator with XRE-family HTH domain